MDEHIKGEAIELFTYPDNDLYFCKLFEVPKDILLDVMGGMSRFHVKTGIDNDSAIKDFLQNYEWAEAHEVYEKAKHDNKLVSEVELVISKDIIREGLNKGYVRLESEDMACAETVCFIGEQWFYFGGTTAEELTPEEYRRCVPTEDIVNDIFDVLEGFRKDSFDREEYEYYETFLKEIKDQVDYVESALFGIPYEKVPYSLSYRVNSQLVQIEKDGMITLDGKIIFRDDFAKWVSTIVKEQTAELMVCFGTGGYVYFGTNAKNPDDAYREMIGKMEEVGINTDNLHPSKIELRGRQNIDR